MNENSESESRKEVVIWKWLGRLEYSCAMDVMNRFAAYVDRNDISGMVIFLEHPHVITLGRRADEKDIIAAESLLEKHRTQVIRVDRGGKATCHSPGQLIGYPILNLKRLRIGIKTLVEGIESTVIEYLSQLGISATRINDRTGVWVDAAKICAVGMRVQRHVTSHGFALYLDCDLSVFDCIIPCGMIDMKVTSAANHIGSVPKCPDAAKSIADIFGRRFNFSMVEAENIFNMIGWEAA